MSLFFPKKEGTPSKASKKKERDELIETLEDKIIELENKLKEQKRNVARIQQPWALGTLPEPMFTTTITRVDE